jgi:hypothetical protein
VETHCDEAAGRNTQIAPTRLTEASAVASIALQPEPPAQALTSECAEPWCIIGSGLSST